jgi:hypothetical protein
LGRRGINRGLAQLPRNVSIFFLVRPEGDGGKAEKTEEDSSVRPKKDLKTCLKKTDGKRRTENGGEGRRKSQHRWDVGDSQD